MTSLALAEPSSDAYAVDFAPTATLALIGVPSQVATELRRRLRQIAEVAAIAGGLGFVVLDGIGSTLHLEIDGHEVSYAVSDDRRALMVLSVVPAATH